VLTLAKIKKVLSYGLIAVVLTAMAVPLMPAQKVEAAGWWNASWDYRMKLTIDNSGQAENLIDFPMLVHLDAGDIDWTHVQNAGQDIRFVDDDDSTELDFEIEDWDDTISADIWVEVPQIDASSNTDFIYMYYGNGAAADGQDVSGTWNANYMMVQHMYDDPNVASITDSTSNSNDGAKKGNNEPNEVAGNIYKGQDFDGNNDYVVINDAASLDFNTSDFTLEAWVKFTSGQRGCVLAKASPDHSTTAGQESYFLRANSSTDDGKLRAGITRGTAGQSVSAKSVNSYRDGAWHHMAATYDRSGNLTLYVDGDVEIVTADISAVGDIDSTKDLYLGCARKDADAPYKYYNGDSDEIRIQSGLRSAEWVKAQYLSMTDAWITFGAEEAFDPPVVATGLCTGFEHTWSIVNGSITDEGVGDVLEVGFDYGLDTAYGNSITVTGTWNTGDDFWDWLSPLTAGTLYHYRAKARNANGWGYGANAIFCTSGSDTLYEFWNTGVTGELCATGDTWYAQSFTTGATAHTVSQVRLKLYRVNNPGIVTVGIYRTSALHPTGLPLTEGTIDGDLLTVVVAGEWKAIDMEEEVSLEANTMYAIVVDARGAAAGNTVCWKLAGAGGYAGGSEEDSTDGGISWATVAGVDFYFEVWGNPCMKMHGAKVFRNYLEANDWLIVCSYNNTYPVYYPSYDPEEYFLLQLVDNVTVKAQETLPAWGYRPGSIYLSADVANSLQWGEITNYKIRMYGDFGANPVEEYAFVAADWIGDDMLALDRWALTTGELMEENDNAIYIENVGAQGKVFNKTGGPMFMLGIPALEEVRPHLFEWTLHTPGYDETDTWTHAGQPDWEASVGTYIAGTFTGLGAPFNLSGKVIGLILIIGGYMIIAGLLAMIGHVALGLILPYPLILIGARFGFVPIVGLAVATAIVVILLIWSFWLSRT